MFENLIDYVNDCLLLAERAIMAPTRNLFYHQAFGAVSFFCGYADSQTQKEMAEQMWNEEWQPAFIELIMTGAQYDESEDYDQ